MARHALGHATAPAAPARSARTLLSTVPYCTVLILVFGRFRFSSKPAPKLGIFKKGDPAKASSQAARRSEGAAKDALPANSKKSAAEAPLTAKKPAAKKAPAKAFLPDAEIEEEEALVVDDELEERTALQAFIAAEPGLTDVVRCSSKRDRSTSARCCEQGSQKFRRS